MEPPRPTSRSLTSSYHRPVSYCVIDLILCCSYQDSRHRSRAGSNCHAITGYEGFVSRWEEHRERVHLEKAFQINSIGRGMTDFARQAFSSAPDSQSLFLPPCEVHKPSPAPRPRRHIGNATTWNHARAQGTPNSTTQASPSPHRLLHSGQVLVRGSRSHFSEMSRRKLMHC